MKKIIPLLVLGFLLTACRETVDLMKSLDPPACEARVESCNGIDDDCDGRIDNPEQLGISPCYTGDTNDLLHGECRFGINRCSRGMWSCEGQVAPRQEVCNGKDDNCDGIVDEGVAKGVDIVFVVDYSGSMVDKIANIKRAVSGWSTKYANRNDIRVALVAAPSEDTRSEGRVVILSPLTSVEAIMSVINAHDASVDVGQEATIDSVYLLSDPSNPLNMNWTEGNGKIIFLFTDELPQSYLDPEVTEREAQLKASANSVRVFVFTTEFFYWRSWDPYPLTDSSLLSDDLDKAIMLGLCN